jgi:hypothetical protein
LRFLLLRDLRVRRFVEPRDFLGGKMTAALAPVAALAPAPVAAAAPRRLGSLSLSPSSSLGSLGPNEIDLKLGSAIEGGYNRKHKRKCNRKKTRNLRKRRRITRRQ